jgi:Na+/H+ antiporter NhaD/arsenite permease-like protein
LETRDVVTIIACSQSRGVTAEHCARGFLGGIGLVAGLFVLVEAIEKAGAIGVLSDLLRLVAGLPGATVAVGGMAALVCNNFSIAGSLATILWLIALRREGEE